MPRPRVRENGFEACNHTCTQLPCTNKRTKTTLWPKEGNSCGRHARNAAIHPQCSPPCPAVSKNFIRNVHPSEYPRCIRDMLDAGFSPEFIDEFFSKHVAQWRGGTRNWPPIPSSRFPMNPGPSRARQPSQEDMEVDDVDEEEESTDEEEEEEEYQVQRLIAPSTSRSPFVSQGNHATASHSPEAFSYIPKSVQPRTFKLLYVPDPSRDHRKHGGVKDDPAWITCKLTNAQLVAIRSMKGFYLKVSSAGNNSAGEGTYRLTEWLWTMVCLSEHKTDLGLKSFDVSYMLWKDFKETLVTPHSANNKRLWDFVRTRDIIIGGMDYMAASCYDDYSDYGLDGESRKTYDRTLAALCRVVKFWPPVPQLRAAADKWSTIRILDVAAANHGSQRPKTTILTPGGAIPPGTVLKRSHSDRGDHVILPPQSVVSDNAVGDRKRRELGSLRTWSELKTSCEEQSWASQEYVETLRTLGEWRCFIVGGHIISVVHTVCRSDGHWDAKHVWHFKPLHQIRALWANRNTVPVTAKILANPDSGDRIDLREGWEEFKVFVDGMYRELVAQESNPTGDKSSLTVFFRMDIGLMFDAEGNPSYFVSDVARTQNMILWLKTLAGNRTMLGTFARILHTRTTQSEDIYTF